MTNYDEITAEQARENTNTSDFLIKKISEEITEHSKQNRSSFLFDFSPYDSTVSIKIIKELRKKGFKIAYSAFDTFDTSVKISW